MASSPRKVTATAVVVALLVTLIGSLLLPLGLSRSLRGSPVAGIALSLWAVLLAPGISFTSLVSSPGFERSHFRLFMSICFVLNVLTWTGVLFVTMRFVASVRRRQKDVPVNPA